MCDLRSGSKHIADIFVACFFRFFQQICLYRRIIYQMVYAVSIVPENPEVLCLWLQCGKALYYCIAVDNAAGVGVHRYAPDCLNGVIFCHQLFHKIHIRAVFQHRNVYQLHAQEFTDSKVAVIAGNRAQYLYLVILAPGLAAHHAVGHCQRHCPVHNVQAGVAADNDIFRLYAQHRCKECLCFRQSVQTAIVPAVQSVFCPIIFFCQTGGNPVGQIQLLRRRLTSGHIQLQICCLKCSILLLAFCLKRFQLFPIHFCYSHCSLTRPVISGPSLLKKIWSALHIRDTDFSSADIWCRFPAHIVSIIAHLSLECKCSRRKNKNFSFSLAAPVFRPGRPAHRTLSEWHRYSRRGSDSAPEWD